MICTIGDRSRVKQRWCKEIVQWQLSFYWGDRDDGWGGRATGGCVFGEVGRIAGERAGELSIVFAGLVWGVGGGGDLSFDRKMSEKGFNFRGSHFVGMTFVVK